MLARPTLADMLVQDFHRTGVDSTDCLFPWNEDFRRILLPSIGVAPTRGRASALNEPTLTSRTLYFVRGNWGNLASVAGLVLSGVAACFAKRASSAARAAREAVLSNSLAEEINLAQKLAAEVTTLVDLGKHDLARLRCNDLHDRTLTIISRWDATLSTASKNNLLSAKSQIESLRAVSTRLFVTAVVPTPRQVSQMQTSCAKIRDIFVEEHASATRRNDEADNG
jgi:hypothetical protein